jgi:hypothetical protein
MADGNKLRDIAKQVIGESALSADFLYRQMVPTSLDILLIAIDQCHYFMNHFTSTSIDSIISAGRRYRGHISARERKELDDTLKLYYEDVDRKAASELARMGLTAEEVREHVEEHVKTHYPVSQEAIISASGVLLEKICSETMNEHFEKYINEPMKLDYLFTSARLGQAGTIEAVLGDALVPLIVTKMEEFLAALVRIGVSLHPKSLGELPSVPNEIVQEYRSEFSHVDMRLWQIDQKVNTFIKGSPSEWQESLLKWTKIDISYLGVDWAMITEMIQRRHVIIHNGGRVDAEYMRKVSDSLKYGLQLGSSLISSQAYMSSVLTELETWAICLNLRWGKHFFKENNAYYPFIADRVIRLEGAGRWSQALAVVDNFLLAPLPTDQGDVGIMKINRWFCLQELGRDNDALRREIIDIGEDEQYSKLGKYALLRQYNELARAIQQSAEGQDAVIDKKALREMPLFQRAMRESPQIKSLLRVGGPTPKMFPKKPSRKRAGR